jgi:hypothetical protein
MIAVVIPSQLPYRYIDSINPHPIITIIANITHAYIYAYAALLIFIS